MDSANLQITNDLAPVLRNIDDAVGVPKKNWYIAIVNNRSEKRASQNLTLMGVENYLPAQQEIHRWKNGRKVKIDRILMPSKIFIHCTEEERLKLVTLPFIFRFMTNIAGMSSTSLRKPLAIVSEEEMQKLKFMLGAADSEVTFTEQFVPGQKIMVIRGPLKGLDGEIRTEASTGVSRLYVNINCLGCASVLINPRDVKKIYDSKG